MFSTCRWRNTTIGGSFGRTLFQKIFKVQKVITLEHPRSADPFGPSIGTRPRWANLFPLRALKYFEILTKSKRRLRWKIRNRRVVLDLPVERPSWARLFPLRTLKNVQSPRGHHGGKSLVRGWFSTPRDQRDPHSRILLDPPVERDPHRRVILDVLVERDPDGRVSSHYGL